MRMTPTRGDIASSGDVTRVSDTVGHRTQVLPTSTGDAAYEAIAKVDAFDEEQSRHISSLLEKVSTPVLPIGCIRSDQLWQVDNLEVELQNKQSTEEQLHSMVKSLEARLEDYVSTIKKLEPKLLQAIADRRKFQAERDAAKLQAATATQLTEARVTEIGKLKEDKVNLEKELATARTALTNSTVPEIAQLAQTQEQLRALQVDKERLEKRILSMQKELEFTRESYQKASSYTTELRNELEELKEENATLQRKASENTIRVAEIQRANEAKEREERIDELEALLRDRDQELRKKSEELKIKTNGRRETRGTSVPRSPRMGSGAMSPRPHFARPAGGSRGGSPAPGDARESFRDTTLFPSSALASSRWTHLTDR
jgi:chromosome segregation ATPase